MPTVMTISGIPELQGMLKLMPTTALAQGALAINIMANKIASDVKQLISETGEPDGVPRRRTGNLLMSVKAGRQKFGLMTVEQSVGVNPDAPDEWGYAGYLEYGTSRMKPRPYLKPTIEKNRSNYKKQLQTAIGLKVRF